MHYWGDKGVDWKGIDDAAEFLGDYCARWGRFRGQTKEKYGTVRFYTTMGYLSLHSLIFPGYVYSQFPKWLRTLDIYVISPVLRFLFGRIWGKWQVFIYRRAYVLALKKWPHLRKEILRDMDHVDLLDGHEDIKMCWSPIQWNEKDKKRLGPVLIKAIDDLKAKINKLERYEAIVMDRKEAGTLTPEELELIKDN